MKPHFRFDDSREPLDRYVAALNAWGRNSAAAVCLQRISRLARHAAALSCIALAAAVAPAQKPDPNLTNASLEELMNMEVTSVSKREERLFKTPAAIYVITNEDIRRSGANTIPDLLRMAPGVNVERLDGSKWAVSARGFNGQFANKLLVLIDGRSVYSPETSGVYWEVQDILLEEVERIEIIRGPGAALWGANSVNGVINIITRKARDTQGGLLVAGGGSQELGFGALRYGGEIGDRAFYRVYAKYFKRAGLVDALGRDLNDGHNAIRGAGRIDWEPTDRDSLTVDGEIYQSNIRETPLGISLANPFAQPVNRPGDFSGGTVLGKWTRSFSDRSGMALQAYYNRFNRDVYQLPARLDTFDVDFQHRFKLGGRQDIVWGLGYRLAAHKTGANTRPVQLIPKDESITLFTAFVHDEISVIKDRLNIAVGSKFVRLKNGPDDSAFFNAQPTIRMSWSLRERQTIWAAVSRAVRTKSRSDDDLRFNLSAQPGPHGIPVVVRLSGNKGFEPEVVLGWEMGYRVQPSRRFSLDAAAFYNVYDRLLTQEPGAPFLETEPPPAHIVAPLTLKNLMKGETYGAEAAVNLDLNANWRLAGSYSFLRMQLHRLAESRDSLAEAQEGSNPRHQFQIRSYLRLPRSFEADGSLYYVSSLAYQGVPRYARFDLRLGWRREETIEISVVLQNLAAGRRAESGGKDALVLVGLVRPSVYGKLAWRF